MQLPLCATCKQGSNLIKSIVLSIVADPDPSDPHVFGLLDPDPDPLVRGVDTDPSITKQK
jgi:hypothetical protein